ncbi:MAG TPA: hypothetical protein PKA19_12940 [Bacillota bacterium]|nr:hypothetical protein [Bacillota bacterium]
MDKLPPIEKIYEAYSAVADSRVILHEDHASVLSSDRSKEYDITWDRNIYASNDNATYWQGYAGYPIIAVLMKQGKLPLDMSIASRFAGINWTELNAKYKRDYGKAVAEVLDGLGCDNDEKEAILVEIRHVYEEVKTLDIQIKRGAPYRSKK